MQGVLEEGSRAVRSNVARKSIATANSLKFGELHVMTRILLTVSCDEILINSNRRYYEGWRGFETVFVGCSYFPAIKMKSS
jgi:hypothetical protein